MLKNFMMYKEMMELSKYLNLISNLACLFIVSEETFRMLLIIKSSTGQCKFKINLITHALSVFHPFPVSFFTRVLHY